MFIISLRVTLCFYAILIECENLKINSQFPQLFESALSYLAETLEWESNESVDVVKVLPEYDFIVVGAGSAGSVVANRLSEIAGWQVLLIEAGQDATHIMDIPLVASLLQASKINWDYKTVPMNTSCLGFKGNRCRFPRGKVMGGSSILNYMIYTRGNRKDYDDWARMGNTGWSYDEVLKYFIKSENANLSHADTDYHGKNGLLAVSDIPYRTPIAKAFVDAASQIGLPIIDVNGEKQIGVNYIQATMKRGRRWSANTAFLFPAKHRANLHVKKHSTVTRILTEANRAVGVEFVTGRETHRVSARKEVIVCGGAVNSPQLLMLSGIGPRKHLADKRVPLVRDLPVGENLMDHVALGSLTVTVNSTVSLILDRLLAEPRNIDDFLTGRGGPFAVPGGAEALAFLDTAADGGGRPDLELLLLSGQYSSFNALPALFGFKRDVYDRVYGPTEGKDGFIVFPMIMRPKSRGRVWLRDADPFSHPLIDPNYFADETDLDVAVAGVRVVQRMLETDAMRKIGARILATPLPGCAQHVFDTDDYWKCSARHISNTVYHLSGTCKMGPDGDLSAVVDQRLRVHGVRGLRVVDASVMPQIPVAHTNGPTIMIGEKGADMIKEDWGA